MEYKNIGYEIYTNKIIQNETRIVTVSDLNWNYNLSHYDMNNLAIEINDLIPKYIFILGNLCTYDNLKNPEFRKNFSYFLKLLQCIGKSYVVFGNQDYKVNQDNKNINVNIDQLLQFYNSECITPINNNIIYNDDINIVGFNKIQETYNNIEKAKNEVLELLSKIDKHIDKNKFSVFITHYELSHLKIEKELLKTFDLILTSTKYKIIKEGIFQKEKEINDYVINNTPEMIRTSGVNKGEISLIKIKTLKKD